MNKNRIAFVKRLIILGYYLVSVGVLWAILPINLAAQHFCVVAGQPKPIKLLGPIYETRFEQNRSYQKILLDKLHQLAQDPSISQEVWSIDFPRHVSEWHTLITLNPNLSLNPQANLKLQSSPWIVDALGEGFGKSQEHCEIGIHLKPFHSSEEQGFALNGYRYIPPLDENSIGKAEWFSVFLPDDLFEKSLAENLKILLFRPPVLSNQPKEMKLESIKLLDAGEPISRAYTVSLPNEEELMAKAFQIDPTPIQTIYQKRCEYWQLCRKELAPPMGEFVVMNSQEKAEALCQYLGKNLISSQALLILREHSERQSAPFSNWESSFWTNDAGSQKATLKSSTYYELENGPSNAAVWCMAEPYQFTSQDKKLFVSVEKENLRLQFFKNLPRFQDLQLEDRVDFKGTPIVIESLPSAEEYYFAGRMLGNLDNPRLTKEKLEDNLQENNLIGVKPASDPKSGRYTFQTYGIEASRYFLKSAFLKSQKVQKTIQNIGISRLSFSNLKRYCGQSAPRCGISWKVGIAEANLSVKEPSKNMKLSGGIGASGEIGLDTFPIVDWLTKIGARTSFYAGMDIVPLRQTVVNSQKQRWLTVVYLTQQLHFPVTFWKNIEGIAGVSIYDGRQNEPFPDSFRFQDFQPVSSMSLKLGISWYGKGF